MDLKSSFKAIYNPYTRELLVAQYGEKITNHSFEDKEAWTTAPYVENGEGTDYYLHIQLDYDETMQLLFYPRIKKDHSLNEEFGSYYNSELTEEKKPNNIKLVLNDMEWDEALNSFLELAVEDIETYKKIKYDREALHARNSNPS